MLDSNLLALWVVGSEILALVRHHKRVKSFTKRDYHRLADLLRSYEVVCVTPHVLAETSNLLRSGGLAEPGRSLVLQRFRAMIPSLREWHEPAVELVRDRLFDTLGLADTGLSSFEARNVALVTCDAALHDAALRRGMTSARFFDLR